jgi:chorismate mutase
MPVRGVRGATTAQENDATAIFSATQELLGAILQANPSLQTADLASVFFTLSPDLQAAYPATAARQMGWHQVPLICAQEVPVPGGLKRCIRVLLHWNTKLPQSAVKHVYLRGAQVLRPDWQPPE